MTDAQKSSGSPVMDPRIRELLVGANIGHLATLMADGSPHSVALWVTIVEGDRLAFVADPRSPKGRNIARDPRVALSIVAHENPYRTAQLRGRVVATRTGEEAWDVLDAIARRYTGEDLSAARGRRLRGRDRLVGVLRGVHASRGHPPVGQI